jgi:hypothetical protein
LASWRVVIRIPVWGVQLLGAGDSHALWMTETINRGPVCTEVQCVYTFRSSTHYKDPAVSVRWSHKIVKTFRNQHAPKFSKGKMWMMRQWQHWPVSSQDVTPFENRPELVKHHEHSIEWICAI